jgi:hypothetical protein
MGKDQKFYGLAIARFDKFASKLKKTIKKHDFWFGILTTLIIVIVAAFIFYKRYPYAFHDASFYAEDGTIFARNIYEHGILRSSIMKFNGYLIFGLYGIEDIATVINRFVGNGFMTMAKSLAVTSYLFLGLVCSLPWLLFRKKLGASLALVTVLLLTIFPLGGGDYAVIGGVGNLKFAFFFVTALLVVYRNDTKLCKKAWQFIAIDVAIFICVLTNFFSIVLIPIALFRYKDDFMRLWKKRKLPKLTIPYYSLIVLALASFIYCLAVYIPGIPALLNYPLAVGPIHPQAVLPLLYRGSAFGLLFPLSIFPDTVAILTIFVLLGIVAWRARERVILIILGAMIIINYLGFLLNRPGVTTLYMNGPSTADTIMFFYAGTLIFTFAVAYGIRHWFDGLTSIRKMAFIACAILFFVLVLPKADDDASSYASYEPIPTLENQIRTLCPANQPILHINVYPVYGQVVILPHKLACDYRSS